MTVMQDDAGYRKRRSRRAAVLAGFLGFVACSGGASNASNTSNIDAPTDAALTADSSEAPTHDQQNDCRNPSRIFQCPGEGCCTEEPTCRAGQLPFTDECGCGCLVASCQPGDRSYVATSPHECAAAGTRPECHPQNETPFDDECGCGCINIENAACDAPNRTYVCRGYNCCTGIDYSCPEGARGFDNACGCGCDGVSSAAGCDQPNRIFICRGPDCCSGLNFGCREGEQIFDNACGCGCER
jgi:hypothetical protein